MVEYTTLQVHRETKERLSALRQGGESFDALVRRLLDEAIQRQEERFLAELDRLYEDEDAFETLE